MNKRWSLAGLLLLAAATGANAEGTTVYRSVNDQGVVSFTDTPPANPADASTLHIQVSPAQNDAAAQARLEQMRETTDRISADRREREEHRAQLRELAAREQGPQQAVQGPDYSDQYYNQPYVYPYYPVGPRWPRPRPPHHGVRPVPPLLQPPVDTEAWSRSHNSQLMRPILPRARP